MNYYYSGSALINGMTSLCLAYFVFVKNRHAEINKKFTLFGAAVAFWSFSLFLWSLAGTESRAIFWIRVLLAGAALIPATFLPFVFILIGKDIKSRGPHRTIVNVNYACAAAFLLLSGTPYFIAGVRQELSFQFWPSPGVLFIPFLAYFLFNIAYSHLLMYQAIKASGSETAREQIRLVALGTFLGFIGGSTNYFLYYDIKIPPVANILVALYVCTVAYAIVRHQLMGIEVIIKKTLVFAGLLASVLAILILPTLLFQEYLLRDAGIGGRIAGLIAGGIVIIFTMRKIEDFLIKITDKYLFQKKYDYKKLLKTFTSDVLTVLDLDNLVDLTVDKLADIIKLGSCAVLLFDEERQQFTIRASKNVNDRSVGLSKADTIVVFLDNTHGYVLRSELDEKGVSIPSSVRGVMDTLNAELVIPMVLHEKMIGMLSLGKKKSDEGYVQDDLDILLPLARTLAIAISNAELFEELGKTQAEAAQKEKMAVIGTLSAGINHEICNPLGIARGQCEAFLLNIKDGIYKDKSPQELIHKAEEIMAKVIKETDRATAITKKLSGFAKPAKGEAELVDINKEVDEVLGLVGYELKLDKIEFDKRVDKDLPRILVDRKQFQEVLFNLIRNAGQAIGEKGKIAVSARAKKGRVVVDVQDTGSGIPENKIKELFNPFFTTKEPGKGTGLGLFIVRQVVEKNGGKIYLKRTKVAEGTTFTIEFPAAAWQKEDGKAYETADSRDRR